MQQPDTYLERAAQLFPKLSDAQLARVAKLARRREVTADEVLIEVGASAPPFFVVLRGAVEIRRFGALGTERIAVHGPREFTGEMNMLSGRRSMPRHFRPTRPQ